MHGNETNKIKVGMLDDTLQVKIEPYSYIPGMFTIVPFRGRTLLIAKDAGASGSWGDAPKYDLKKRYQAFTGVAKHISTHPQSGQDMGAIYIDVSMATILNDMFPDMDLD